MDSPTAQIEPDVSWSQNTTPASDDIEEIVRIPPRMQSRERAEGRPRFLRGPIRRRRVPIIKSENFTECGALNSSISTFSYPVLSLKHSMEDSDMSSTSSSLTIITSAASSCTGPWSSSSGFVEEEEEDNDECWDREDDDRHSTQMSNEDIVVPKLEPDDEDMNLTDVKEASLPATPSVNSSPIVKRPRGRPRKHPRLNPEDKAKVAKNRSKTGCITCRRRKKKCDEKKPGC